MAEQANDLNEHERHLRNQMLFTLSELDKGTLAMVVTPNEWKKKELYLFLKGHLREYEFFDLDLTPYNYNSLYKALAELLPSTILESQPVQYLVSVTGLESSLYTTEDGKIEFSPLLAQLNFERELIFHQPYIVVLWVSESFDRELQRRAPDLMQWMSKRFVFEERGSDGMEVAEAEIQYGTVQKKGRISERLERIRQLQEAWEKLYHDNRDQVRVVKDKIELLLLLGKEYAAAFEYDQAETAFKKAIALNSKIKAGKEAILFYELGVVYWRFNRYDLASETLEHALTIVQKDRDTELMGDVYHALGLVYQGKMQWKKALLIFRRALDWNMEAGYEDRIGNTFHQIGRVYEEQGKWTEALANYNWALDWNRRTGNEYGIGSTYHQIGMVYQKQEKWDEALANYNRALYWKVEAGDEYGVGSTYHQIGRIYEKQKKWDEALTNYNRALDWNTKTGNEYEMGSTYHQIGWINHLQKKWAEALENYNRALDWKIKTGNEYGVGSTYHLIGQAYQDQGMLSKAMEWFAKAVENQMKFDHPNLKYSQESLTRIQKEIADRSATS